MARPIKRGLDYFPLDTDFLSNRKIRKIINACGPNSVTILICLLCNIYKDKGYYIVWDKEMPFDIADIVGVSEGAVSEVVKKALQVELFDNNLYNKFHILSSCGIQNRFKSCTAKRKDVEIIPDYWVIDDINSVNGGNNLINGGNNEQRKENKRNNSPNHTRVGSLFPPEEFKDKSLEECFKEVHSNVIWKEQFCMNIHMSGHQHFTFEDFDNYLKLFFTELQNRGVKNKSSSDAMSHFASWLKLELKNKKNESKISKEATPNGLNPYPTNQGSEHTAQNIDTDAEELTSWIDSIPIGR